MIGGAANSHTLESRFVLSPQLVQFPSLAVPHFESLMCHVTMANKICFGHKYPIPLHALLTNHMHSVINAQARGS